MLYEVITDYSSSGAKMVEVTVHDKDGNPAPYVLVQLNHALTGMTDNVGKCRFVGVSVDEDEVRVFEPEKYVIKGVRTEVMR